MSWISSQILEKGLRRMCLINFYWSVLTWLELTTTDKDKSVELWLRRNMRWTKLWKLVCLYLSYLCFLGNVARGGSGLQGTFIMKGILVSNIDRCFTSPG